MLRPTSDPADARLWRCVTLTIQRSHVAHDNQPMPTSGALHLPETIEVFERAEVPRFIRLAAGENARENALSRLRALYPGSWELGEEEPVEGGRVDIEVRRVYETESD